MDRKVPDEEEKKNPTIGSYLYWIIYIQIYVMKKKNNAGITIYDISDHLPVFL